LVNLRCWKFTLENRKINYCYVNQLLLCKLIIAMLINYCYVNQNVKQKAWEKISIPAGSLPFKIYLDDHPLKIYLDDYPSRSTSMISPQDLPRWLALTIYLDDYPLKIYLHDYPSRSTSMITPQDIPRWLPLKIYLDESIFGDGNEELKIKVRLSWSICFTCSWPNQTWFAGFPSKYDTVITRKLWNMKTTSKIKLHLKIVQNLIRIKRNYLLCEYYCNVVFIFHCFLVITVI